ncbi:hypothetical protein AB1Y20_013232 [Prymnesium parvum]|uniref:Palmitoyltransferase n=1 Tax=Prymnesium parvum TaxID=97485 RepID=A0AB34IMR5_PRYPA
MDVVFWVVLCVGGTAVPMALDLLRSFLPRKYQMGRLVAGWQKPLLLSMVALLCVSGYYLFWASVLPYSHPPLSAAGIAHGVLATLLWVNTVWNYALCAAVDPGVLLPDEQLAVEGGSAEKPRWPGGSRYCAVCEVRVLHLDHHCPFTGGCIGSNNYRFFLLFCLHCSAGMAYACCLSFFPFRDCVLFQCTMPALGIHRRPPPDDEACMRMAGRSLLFLPCGVLFSSLCCLATFHFLLLANGLTTAQFVRRFKSRGVRSLSDLFLLQVESETDKWGQLWGGKDANLTYRLRILLLPSLPCRRKLSPGVAGIHHWLVAISALTALGMLIPFAASALWNVSVRITSLLQ